MGTLRALLYRNGLAAAMLLAVALSMKALVPAGYMVGPQGEVLTVQICADTQNAGYTKQIVIPQQGDAGALADDHGGSGGYCTFASLAFAFLPGADPVLLGLALAFTLALGFAPIGRPVTRPVPHLRPPLRGPPRPA